MEGLRQSLENNPHLWARPLEKILENPIAAILLFFLAVTAVHGVAGVLSGEGKAAGEGESRAPDDYYIG